MPSRLAPLLALLACVPALVAPGLVAGVAPQWELARSANPFFLPGHAIELYLAAPAATVSAFVLFLLPGMLLVRAVRDPGDLMALTVLGFGASLLLLIAVGTASRLITAGPLGREILLVEWIALAVLAAVADAMRRREPSDSLHEGGPPPNGRRAFWLFAIAWLGAAALAPKIHWENFNIDGIEALEFGRSLGSHVLPYWDVQSGTYGFYRNFMLFAWPDHFFITLFGPIEAAVRLPILLFLVVVFAALVLLIEHDRPRRLGVGEETALALGMALFLVVQAFNTNYEPFFADLAETAATDTLWIACFLAAIWALWSGRTLWFWAFGLMNYAASPGGLFLLLALCAAAVTLPAGVRGPKVGRVLVLLLACGAITAAFELYYGRVVLEGAKDQFSSINLVRRLFPPTLTEWARWSTLVVATGVAPALALLAARRRDALAWALTSVTVIYFAVVYAQAWASVHQFTPVMVLPHAVFWRGYLGAPGHRRALLLPVGATLAVFCLILSLPRHDRINLAVRDVGLATDFRVADYESEYEEAARAAHAVYWLFPEEYRLEYPEQPWGTDKYSWLYHATRPKPAGTAVAYVIQDPAAPAPAGARLAGRDSVVAAYVVDDALWQRQREPDVPRVVMSPMYEPVLRSTYRFFRAYTLRMQEEAASGRN